MDIGGPEAESKIEEFKPHLGRLGLCAGEKEQAIFTEYARQLLSVTSADDAAGAWIDHAMQKTMLEYHLLLAGVSSFTFQKNVVVLGPNTAQCFVGEAAFKSRGKSAEVDRGSGEGYY